MPSLPRTSPCVLALALLAGCGQPTPQLVPVSGKVYYRGQPLPSGTIVYTPDPQRGGKGLQAWSEIRDGSYQLLTKDQPGAAPGWHRITIADLPPAEAGEKAALNPERVNPNSPRLPARYRDPELSGEWREVKPGQENVHELRLE